MKLFDFQEKWVGKAVTYLKTTENPYPMFNLFLDMGLGKTYTSLEIVKQLQVKNILIICPRSLISMWDYELNKYFRCNPPQYEIVNYEKFASGLQKDRTVDLVILDEAHRVKNIKSQTHKFIHEQVHAKYVLNLTGTPITRDYMDLFGILTCVQSALRFNGLAAAQFNMRYVVNRSTAHTEELMAFIRPFTIFAKLEDYVKDIPNYEDIVIPVELNLMQKVALHSLYLSNKPTLAKIIEAQQLTSLSKMMTCEDLIYDILQNGEKVIVFTKFDDEFDTLMKKYEGICVGINGKAKDRSEVCKVFQENPEVMVLIANLQTASLGLTLTKAHKCIFYTETTNWADMDQSKGRIRRIGQTNFCTYYYLVCMDSPDEIIHQSNIDKTDLIEEFENKYGGT